MEKRMCVLNATSFRSLIEQSNSIGIQKDDIVSIIKTDEDIVLVYYK
jgi:hypothetical protein